jgi:hypothetical protein
MVAFIATALGGLLLGAAFGWASRRHAHWCPQCGGRLTCPLHDPMLRETMRTGRAIARVPAGLIIPLQEGNSGPGGPL